MAAPIETTRAPPPSSTERRVNDDVFSNFVMTPPSTHHLGGALDRLENADMRAAAALQTGERILDFGFARFIFVAQESGGGHDPAVDTVAALQRLLLDVSRLQRMRLFRRAEAGQRHDLAIAHRGQRRDAGADRLPVEMYGAGAALRQPAAELRIVEADVVAQGVKQRHVGVSIDRMGLAVDVEAEFLGHSCSLARNTAARRYRLPTLAGESLVPHTGPGNV